jgi:predicted DNA-binding transcriptional regulator AlpA
MVEEHFARLAGHEVMTASQIAKYLQISRGYVYTIFKKDENFPLSFRLTPNSVRLWRKEDIDSWVKKKMNGGR